MNFGLVIADRDDEWVTLSVTVENGGKICLLGLSLPGFGGPCLAQIALVRDDDLNRHRAFKLRMPAAVFDAALLGIKEKSES